jgi:hypothetical protein
MRNMQQIWKFAAVAAFVALAGAAHAAPPPCVAPNNGSGTVTLPPAGCQYLSPTQFHAILNGLPPNTTIIISPIHKNFICRQSGTCNVPGGPLGGEVENFSSTGVFQLSGTGALAGWTRTINVPLTVQTAVAPRTPGAAVQSLATNMQRIQGAITGDPDFDSFEVLGGTANGYSSPGQTKLTRQANGSFLVDSTFTVGYRIRFVGAAGGKLAGYSGETVGTVAMAASAATQ